MQKPQTNILKQEKRANRSLDTLHNLAHQDSLSIPESQREHILAVLEQARTKDKHSFTAYLARKYGTNQIGKLSEKEFRGIYIAVCVLAARALGLPLTALPEDNEQIWNDYAENFRVMFSELTTTELRQAVSAAHVSQYEQKPNHYQQFSSMFMIDLIEQYEQYAHKLRGVASRAIESDKLVMDHDKTHHYTRIVQDSIIPKFREFIEEPELLSDYTDLHVIYEILEEFQLFKLSDQDKIALWNRLTYDKRTKVQAKSEACILAFSELVEKGYTPEKLELELLSKIESL